MGFISIKLTFKWLEGNIIAIKLYFSCLKDNMLDFGFATYEEIGKELGARLKAQRLMQRFTQGDLAARAGVSPGTVKNLENKGQSSMESAVRIVLALGLSEHLQELFKLQVKSIAQMEQAEQSHRLRAPRRVVV